MMHAVEQIGQVMEQHALTRYRTLAFMTLRDFSQPHPAFCAIPAPFVQTLAAQAEAAYQWLDAGLTGRDGSRRDQLLGLFIDNTVASIHQHNPYIQIRGGTRHALTDLYDVFMVDFRDSLTSVAGGTATAPRLARALRGVLVAHQRDLDAYLADLARLNPGLNLGGSEPVCSTYSPAFQLEILHLAGDPLPGPVLDVGCGPAGELVAELREQGIPAAGVDRDAQALPGLLRADWFDFPLEAGTWGLIISHMAFSVHFLHHHVRPDGQPEAYARRYMALLGALRPGGRLCYTPGLPFMEALLPPERYTVRRYALPGVVNLPASEVFADALGANVLYTTHVLRH